jgi:hypothetical protein
LKIVYYIFILIVINGDWGLGIGDWGLGPIPHTPNPKTQTPIKTLKI